MLRVCMTIYWPFPGYCRTSDIKGFPTPELGGKGHDHPGVTNMF